MCIVSMVHDHFEPILPKRDFWVQPNPLDPLPGMAAGALPFTFLPTAEEMAEMRKVIAEFREAVAAAKVVDKLTGQPDCVDPEKAKLEERVAALEEKLAALATITAWGGPP